MFKFKKIVTIYKLSNNWSIIKIPAPEMQHVAPSVKSVVLTKIFAQNKKSEVLTRVGKGMILIWLQYFCTLDLIHPTNIINAHLWGCVELFVTCTHKL